MYFTKKTENKIFFHQREKRGKMDVQRSNKRGKANYFIVIPITQANTKNNLREVQTHLENKYPSARAELRKVFKLILLLFHMFI